MSVRNAEAITEWVEVLDPDLRARARDYLNSAINTPDARKTYVGEHDRVKSLHAALGKLPSDAPVPLPVIGMVGFFCLVVASRTSLIALLSVLVIASTVMLWSYAEGQKRKTERNRLIDAQIPDTLMFVTRGKNEDSYRNAVVKLLPSGTTGFGSPTGCREQMERLNTLLDSGRRLDTVRAEISTATAGASPETLRAERAALQTRADRASDTGTRAALLQSAALCEERLRRAESLSALLERVDAEQELVHQAFGTADGSLSALRISPLVAGIETSTDADAASNVAAIADAITRQTQAVEAAVQELGIRR